MVTYGRDPSAIVRYGAPKSPIGDFDRHLQERDDILSRLKEHFKNAQLIMKMQKDQKRLDVRLEMWDLVHFKKWSLSRESTWGNFLSWAAIKLQVTSCSSHLSVTEGTRVWRAATAITQNITYELEPHEEVDVRQYNGEMEVLVEWKGTWFWSNMGIGLHHTTKISWPPSLGQTGFYGGEKWWETSP